MTEQWKDIIGYEEFYQISNLGNIRSKDRYIYLPQNKSFVLRKGKNIKPNKVAYDYLQVTLYDGKTRKSKYVATLVMENFVGIKPHNLVINHIDENKNNNSLENLEYITPKQNNNHGTRIERARQKMINGKKSKPIKMIDLITNEIKTFPSMSEAERQGYGNQQKISLVCNGRRKKHKNCLWEFI